VTHDIARQKNAVTISGDNTQKSKSSLLESLFPHPGPPPKRPSIPEHLDRHHCQHIRSRYVRRFFSNGSERFGIQCLSCGYADVQSWLGAKRAAEVYQCSPEDWQEYDDEFTENKNHELHMFFYQKHYSQQSKTNEWWVWYGKYLKSAAWKNLRALILKRDSGRCVICKAKADEVHHLTYDQVGYEPPEDLISICDRCHNTIHPSKNSRGE